MEYVLHNFIKYFSNVRVNQLSNKCLNGCLVFAICYNWFHIKDPHKTFA